MKESFLQVLRDEVARIDTAQTAKRHEKIIEGFTADPCPRALINGKGYLVFNSNDYLGLRHHEKVRAAEEHAIKTFGSGPGAVRFISGTLKVHRELEKEVAAFHKRDDALIFSSAFAASLAVIHCMIKGQSKDSVVSGNVLVVSDALNHRCIIDGIRLGSLPKDHKTIFTHLDLDGMKKILSDNKGKFSRAMVITDGVFSMLGEHQDLEKMKKIVDECVDYFPEGIVTIVDDSHGVGCFGMTGRGCEEVCSAQCDLLIGTFGKAFGGDGGYVVGDQTAIEYLRESAATYIYSNPIPPGTAGAVIAALEVVQGDRNVLARLQENISYFKERIKRVGFSFAADSAHPIQPILIGDAQKTKALTTALFEKGILVTAINYPVVPKGSDEIRVQISATHTKKEMDEFIEIVTVEGKRLAII